MQTLRRLHNGTWFECRPASNGVWYIHWSEQRRSRRESTRETEVAAASAYFDEWLILRDRAPNSVLTCRDLFDAKYGLTTGSAGRAGHAWLHLEPVFGALSPSDVTQTLVDRYIDRRRRDAAASTVRYEIACLYASWNRAVRHRHLASTDLPVLDAPPPGSPPRERWLNDAEIEKLMAAASGSPRVSLFLWLALDTAGRRTAICELTWEQIDFETGVIHLNPPGRQQTRKRRASVPMSKRLRAVLQTAHATRSSRYVLGSAAPINSALAGVAARSGVAGVTPHVLRHTAATHMARRGVSLWIIAKILGNTLEQVEKVYAKFAPDFARDAVEQIGAGAMRPRAVGEE